MVNETLLGFGIILLILVILIVVVWVVVKKIKAIVAKSKSAPKRKVKEQKRGGFSKQESEASYWTGGEDNN